MNSDAKPLANDDKTSEPIELVPLIRSKTDTNGDPSPSDRVDGIVHDLLADAEDDEAKKKTPCYEGNRKKLASVLVVVVILLPLVTKLLCGGVDVGSTTKDLAELTAFSLHPIERNDSRAPNESTEKDPQPNVNETDAQPPRPTLAQRVPRTETLGVNETGASESLETPRLDTNRKTAETNPANNSSGKTSGNDAGSSRNLARANDTRVTRTRNPGETEAVTNRPTTIHNVSRSYNPGETETVTNRSATVHNVSRSYPNFTRSE